MNTLPSASSVAHPAVFRSWWCVHFRRRLASSVVWHRAYGSSWSISVNGLWQPVMPQCGWVASRAMR